MLNKSALRKELSEIDDVEEVKRLHREYMEEYGAKLDEYRRLQGESEKAYQALQDYEATAPFGFSMHSDEPLYLNRIGELVVKDD